MHRIPPDQVQEGFDPAWVEVTTPTGFDLFQRLVWGERRTVDPVGPQVLEGVGHGNDPRTEWDVLALEALRVAGAVKFFVVMPDQRGNVVETLDRTDDVGADLGMPPHPGHFIFRERHRLPENPVRDPDLADVMKDGAQTDGGRLVAGQAHPFGTGAGQLRQPLGVPARIA